MAYGYAGYPWPKHVEDFLLVSFHLTNCIIGENPIDNSLKQCVRARVRAIGIATYIKLGFRVFLGIQEWLTVKL